MTEGQQQQELSPEQTRLVEVTLDSGSIGRNSVDVEHEREVAIFDLLERNPFVHVMLSLSPFRRLVKDYFLMCESYYQAIKTQPPSRIEAIDMGRRGLHDEGSRLLMERLKGKVLVDIATARRLFTLICALHWKG